MFFGIPSCLHSDQGKSFDNEIIAHLCQMYGVRQSITTPYNPHGNLQCERFNRTLFSLMHSLDQEQKPNWPVYLPSLVYAYNVTPHSTTGFQPYKLMFGCKCNEISYLTLHLNVTQWFLDIFMEHRLNTACSVAQFIVDFSVVLQECS